MDPSKEFPGLCPLVCAGPAGLAGPGLPLCRSATCPGLPLPLFHHPLLFIAACQSHKSKRPCIKEVPLKLSVAVDCSKAVMCVETYSHLSPRGRINNIERDVEKERKEAIA